jgi:hypothetical protein
LDLTIELTDILTAGSNVSRAGRAQPLLICDRCEDADEIVVTIMQIPALDEAWALCGTCAGEFAKRLPPVKVVA